MQILDLTRKKSGEVETEILSLLKSVREYILFYDLKYYVMKHAKGTKINERQCYIFWLYIFIIVHFKLSFITNTLSSKRSVKNIPF